MSILTNWLTESSKLFDIPSEAFIPKPKVKSSVIQLKPLSKPLYDVSFESLEKITHLAFSQKRKMLKTIGGDCETAIGAHSVIKGGNITVEAELFSLDGSERFYEKKIEKIDKFREIGKEIGQILKAKSNNSYKR